MTTVPAYIFVVPTEKSLIAAFESLDIKYQTEPMDVGDIQIRTYNKETDEYSIELIIERKEGKDLAASIKDGRYEEQKARIASAFSDTFGPKNVYYLIEKFPEPNGVYGYDKTIRKAMWSSITNTLYRDNYQVFQSKNVTESAEFISSLKNTVHKFKLGKYDDKQLKIHESILKKKKVTPDDFLQNSLCLIKGVQEDIAIPIVEKYETFACLIASYQRKIDKGCNPEDMLKELKRSSGKMKIGPVISARIYKFFESNLDT